MSSSRIAWPAAWHPDVDGGIQFLSRLRQSEVFPQVVQELIPRPGFRPVCGGQATRCLVCVFVLVGEFRGPLRECGPPVDGSVIEIKQCQPLHRRHPPPHAQSARSSPVRSPTWAQSSLSEHGTEIAKWGQFHAGEFQ
ncbi:hypothetical protein GCM10018780_77470 [Streptomyces lanatus]|nr:hypothetical protein GCM10018780_77470 [Streptomyces lanatus]